ncbi:hypothetical protein NE865_10666 [Phthorimaea operculella]|nr:hypothetical protein NE865_10666 [Phthorimaea operculella]
MSYEDDPSASNLNLKAGSPTPNHDKTFDQLSDLLDTKLNIIKNEITRELKQEYNNGIQELKKEFTATTDFLAAQLKDVKKYVDDTNAKLKKLELENVKLQTEITQLKAVHQAEPSTRVLQKTVTQLQIQMNEKEQALLLNDIEISGVPEFTGESPIHIAMAIEKKLGVTLTDSDVVSAERVGARPNQTSSDGSSNSNSGSQPPASRVRPVVVRLARRAIRDDFLRNARIRRGTTSEEMGLPPHQTKAVHIYERLTKTNRMLFWKARKAGTLQGWKFVWVKDGRIYAKRMDAPSLKPNRVECEQDIKSVFGIDPADII